jgi:hypothetical protein
VAALHLETCHQRRENAQPHGRQHVCRARLDPIRRRKLASLPICLERSDRLRGGPGSPYRHRELPYALYRRRMAGGKNLASSPAIWRRMFEEIPSPNFGLNYDPSHQVWQQMDYIAPLKEFASRIFRVHLKDVASIGSGWTRWASWLIPWSFIPRSCRGAGISTGKLSPCAQNSGYDGPVCVEVEDREFEGDLAHRKQALAISSQYLRRCLVSRSDQYMIQPPSTLSVWPVIASLNSVDKNKHTRATSSGPMRRLRLCSLIVIRFLLGHELSFSLGFDGAGGDAVDANVMLPHLSCQSARKPNDGALRCDVMGQVLQAGKERDRRDIHNGPGSLRTMWGITSFVQ